MIYTKKQLEKMSDGQVDLMVAKKLNLTNIKKDKCYTWDFSTDEDDVKWKIYSPCSNWNDVMPIAEKYLMSLDFFNAVDEHSDYGCWCIGTDGVSGNENMKRAICEVFLMMDIESASS